MAVTADRNGDCRCRHRALLFKYALDYISRQSGRFQNRLLCRMIRGHYYPEGGETGHAWNCVWLPRKGRLGQAPPRNLSPAGHRAHAVGTWHVIDVMHAPTEVYPEGTEKAKQYKRLAPARDDAQLPSVAQLESGNAAGGLPGAAGQDPNASARSVYSIHGGGAGLESIRLSM